MARPRKGQEHGVQWTGKSWFVHRIDRAAIKKIVAAACPASLQKTRLQLQQALEDALRLHDEHTAFFGNKVRKGRLTAGHRDRQTAFGAMRADMAAVTAAVKALEMAIGNKGVYHRLAAMADAEAHKARQAADDRKFETAMAALTAISRWAERGREPPAPIPGGPYDARWLIGRALPAIFDSHFAIVADGRKRVMVNFVDRVLRAVMVCPQPLRQRHRANKVVFYTVATIRQYIREAQPGFGTDLQLIRQHLS
jgi:hypothetical protein